MAKNSPLQAVFSILDDAGANYEVVRRKRHPVVRFTLPCGGRGQYTSASTNHGGRLYANTQADVRRLIRRIKEGETT